MRKPALRKALHDYTAAKATTRDGTELEVTRNIELQRRSGAGCGNDIKRRRTDRWLIGEKDSLGAARSVLGDFESYLATRLSGTTFAPRRNSSR